MGRTEPSVGQPPAGFRREARAKRAKATINQLIPSLLPTHPRARKGIDQVELCLDPPAQKTDNAPKKTDGSVSPEAGPILSLRVADTLTAAHALVVENASPGNEPKVAILNMASPLSPGGGFLNGASSQEESLCMRTTLLPSLKDEFYRLPELGAVYTPDVLVFRDDGVDEVLAKKDRWFVNCITAAMLRSPETDRNDEGFGVYVSEKDRELALQKMRVVMRVAQAKGITHLVLGAWGCGAYGNPVNEVATAWRKVLLPKEARGKKKSKRETWSGIEQIVFAIKDAGMADSFAKAFGDGLSREEASEDDDDAEEEELDPEALRRQELQTRIDELEARIESAVNPRVKEGLTSILASLISQLPKVEEDGPAAESENGSADECSDAEEENSEAENAHS